MHTVAAHRKAVAEARRIVVKVGSRVLVQRSGRPDLARMKVLVQDLARTARGDREIVLVSSGAIAAGMESLKLERRPVTLPDLQMTAAVGQLRLMTTYEKLFAAQHCGVGQVLLTHADLKDRRRHLNARNTVLNFLRHGLIPIVNENDAVAVEEIQFGDNDLLAALVTHLIQADLLILLTTVDGLRKPAGGGKTRRVSFLPRVSDEVRQLARGTDSHLSTGGMATKLDAADDIAGTGGLAVIANGRRPDTVTRILEGRDVGTLIADPDRADGQPLSGRKRWIAFFHRAHGSLIVDDGAHEAIEKRGTSLLPVGIREVVGTFQRGDVVNIKSLENKTIARGLVEYSSEQVGRIMGQKTAEIARILGARDFDEVVHRDNMVVMRGTP